MSRSIEGDFDTDNLKNRKWKGEGVNFNTSIAKKPTEKNRRCTDVLCCLFFTVFLGGMLTATIYGYVSGNPWKLVAPVDGDGRICGYSAGVIDYPDLYITDITVAVLKPTYIFNYGVCVKSCPKQASDTVECVPTNVANPCVPASSDAYGTDSVFSYCVPIYDTLPYSAQQNWEGVKSALEGTTYGGSAVALYESKWAILLSALICLIITFCYVKFMDWCAVYLAWFSVILVQASLLAVGFVCMIYRNDMNCDAHSSTCTWLWWGMVAGFVLSGVYFLVILCNWRSLKVAVATIETAADYVADTKRIILVPLIFFIIGIVTFMSWLMALICVASIGDITSSSVDAVTQTKDIVWDQNTYYMVYFMCFGILWLIAFIIACNEFVIIVSAVTWYFSDKTIEDDDGIPGDSDVRFGFWWAFRYHFGSLAFGSFLLAIVWVIRALFEYVGEKMHEATGNNGFTKCLVGCIRCCLDCFDRFVRYLNRNAYIYMAITSESFCTSALLSFILILKNAAKFAFVEGLADIFMFLAKFFISFATTLVSYFLLKAMSENDVEPWLPLTVIFLFSYLIAAIFIAIFDTSANTILQCYLLD